MSTPQVLFARVTRQSWWKSGPFLLALLVLVFMGWTTARVIVFPVDGIASLLTDGHIAGIELNGPASGKLQVGDKIYSIDGIKWEAASGHISQKRGGEWVEYVIERGDGHFLIVRIQLQDPTPFEILISLVPILVALIFWINGIGVQAFKPADVSANVFFVWCLTSAMTLTAGVASYLGPAWNSNLFNVLLCLIGPLSVHFHLFFPQTWPLRGRRIALWFLYLIGMLGAAPFILFDLNQLRSYLWYREFTDVIRFYLGINLLIVVGLLLYNYFHSRTPGVRAKVRLIALGGGLSALSIVSLTLIPDTLFKLPLIPYQFTFLLLGFLPLTYGYAIFRLHMIEIERHVNRGATYLLVYTILGGIYISFFAVIEKFQPSFERAARVIDTFLILLLVTIFVPLRSLVQRFIDRIFYGGWYDYRLGVTKLTQGLEQATSLEMLARIVSQQLVETLRLEETCVFLRDAGGDFSVIDAAFPPGAIHHASSAYPVLPRSSLTYLLKIGVVERTSLLHSLSEVVVSPEELQLLESEQIHLWVPVIGRGQILGLLALGPKVGGDIFSSDDMDILRVVAREMGPIIENLHLVTHLRNHAADLELRVQERTAELFDAKERVEAVLASVGEGVVVTDLEGKISTVNTAFELQSGYSESEIIGHSLQDLFSDNTNNGFFPEIEAALERGEVWSGEVFGQKKNGGAYDVQLTIAPLRDQTGAIVGYVSSQRNITHQKELERMKDMFIADVSHELRTPTTNISLYLDLLQTANPDKWPQYMKVVKEQSQQLAKLVDDILDLSRLARVRSQKIEFSSVDLDLLIEQVIEAHQPLAGSYGLKLSFECSPERPYVRGEDSQLNRMITNLITNGLRYTLQGEVAVGTSVDGCQVCVEVKDTGIGIGKDDLPHIFERFYRGQNVRQSNIHGTGLGLAIVKEIADLHGGIVQVDSSLNKGSVFRVYLPLET